MSLRDGHGDTVKGRRSDFVAHPPWLIEAATVRDLDQIVRVERDSFSAPWTRSMFEAELGGNPFARFAVARLPEAGGGSGIVAYVCFWIVFEELRLMNLAVDPAWRRRGLATALVRQALREGAKQGTVRATLEVRASNAAARSLYEKLGFRETARRASYYTNPVEDAVLMETPISG